MGEIKSLSPAQTLHRIKDEKALLIDIRDKNTFLQGHIPGSLHLGRDDLPTFINERPKNGQYIICCYRGNSSKSVVSLLESQGFEQVFNLDGGFHAWQQAADEDPCYEINLDFDA